ncbi:hypothetical protein PILCRDRAFT_12705 [Piloderma croceum F 1598]|uniref:Uncharacterized protein n=1 Tax=Piloderma croceum (strain F 1598) TaxID=765440 RepID=A0A0C3EVA9_PILCF|nr:hypothetical protein PILCRDRAFT_12705 [Piloderma croceum F 1598]
MRGAGGPGGLFAFVSTSVPQALNGRYLFLLSSSVVWAQTNPTTTKLVPQSGFEHIKIFPAPGKGVMVNYLNLYGHAGGSFKPQHFVRPSSYPSRIMPGGPIRTPLLLLVAVSYGTKDF